MDQNLINEEALRLKEIQEEERLRAIALKNLQISVWQAAPIHKKFVLWIRSGWTLIVAAMAVVVLFAQAIPVINSIYFDRIAQKQAQYEMLGKLKVGYQLTYFDDLLGKAAIVNQIEDLSEHLYIYPKFVVKAQADENGTVRLMSVTTRDKNFNPQMKLPNGSKVRLGITVFSDVSKEPDIIQAADANAGSYYYEAFWFGGPGRYRGFALSANLAGYNNDIPEKIEKVIYKSKSGGMWDGSCLRADDVEIFRDWQVVNTYTVMDMDKAGFILDESLNCRASGDRGLEFGPDPNQMWQAF